MILLISYAKAGRPGQLDHLLQYETEFGWVLCGCSTSSGNVNLYVTSHHASTMCSDDLLRKFWEVKESPSDPPALTPEERSVLQHFETNHSRTKAGRFVVPLPRKPNTEPIRESRSQVVRRFLALERSLHHKGKFGEVDSVVQEYFALGHAAEVPTKDTDKDRSSVFYLPMHVVYKNSSSTTKVRAVFDASAKSSSGVRHSTRWANSSPPLVDVLLRFQMHRVALTADVSKMY
jgi:hypothetical protein